MIISRGRRFIFVHIPKTGGTSLALALEARAMKDDILIGDTPKAQSRRKRQANLTAKARIWKHMRLAEAEGIIDVNEMAGLFVVTMVRNPWDRILSYYAWLRRQAFDHPAVDLAARTDFSAFLNAVETQASLELDRYADYVAGSDGTDLCDAYIRLEHLDTDLVPFEQHLGFALAPLPHVNRSDRPQDYREAYSDADADLVAKLCAADIVRFGYTY